MSRCHVCVYAGPELGSLAGLMVGPEQGGWQVEEITVVSSRTGHVDRYLPLALVVLSSTAQHTPALGSHYVCPCTTRCWTEGQPLCMMMDVPCCVIV